MVPGGYFEGGQSDQVRCDRVGLRTGRFVDVEGACELGLRDY